MIQYETRDPGKCYLEVSGTYIEIECDAAYMITLIYNDMFKKDPVTAASFRRRIMYAINRAMDAIERGEFSHDDHTA